MIVHLEGLTKSFTVRRGWRALARAPFRSDRTLAVDDVSFDVAEGEIFGLLGQNGAGKTTIFKLLATLILADAGVATIDGHDVARDPLAVRRALAPVLANERSLNWRLSAHENVRLFSALQGLAGAEARTEERRVLAVTGLAATSTKMVGEFSSGMRQRLLIARALLGRPRVLLLDEPTRSLDPISAREFRRFLRDVVVDIEGCTVLLATHDADEVWDLCDRVAILERGRLLAMDRTTLLRDRAGDERFRLWLRARPAAGPARTAALAALSGVALVARRPAAEPGWEEYECAIGGGAAGAARVLATFVGAGEEVARFERCAPSLADLIERVVSAGGAEAHHA